MFSIERGHQPIIYFPTPAGPMGLPLFADLKNQAARISIPESDRPGAIAKPGPIVPKGSIMLTIPPDIANQIRPQVAAERARQKKTADFVAIEVGGLMIYLLADMPGGGQPTLADPLDAGKIIPSPPTQKNSMLAVLLPDAAVRVRPLVEKALADARKADIAFRDGRLVRP